VTDLLLTLLFGLRIVCFVGWVNAWRHERCTDGTLWVFAGLLCTLNMLELRQ
jgi:hypothetical protein